MSAINEWSTRVVASFKNFRLPDFLTSDASRLEEARKVEHDGGRNDGDEVLEEASGRVLVQQDGRPVPGRRRDGAEPFCLNKSGSQIF